VTNGSRFATYVIEGPEGDGDCCVNGAAARLVEKGDTLILAAYAGVDERELDGWRPKVVVIGERNRIREVKSAEGLGVAVS
jgi:aspartate 1-decarboxylase